jgi:hypothetical protein
MEHYSKRGCIRISPDTARLLSKSDKASWYETSETELSKRGEREQSYWLKIEGFHNASISYLGESSTLDLYSIHSIVTEQETDPISNFE